MNTYPNPGENLGLGNLARMLPEVRASITWLRKSRHMDYPREVAIETLAVCNAACSFCPYPSLERKGEKMPDSLIEKIITDLQDVPADLPLIISPFKVNDPLLDVRIYDIMGSINRMLPNAGVRLFTNGSALNEKSVEKINKVERLVHLWVSLNSHDPVEYEKVMQLPMQRTLENLDILHRKKAAGEFSHDVVVSKVRDETGADIEFCNFVAGRYPLFAIGIISRSEWLGVVPGLVASQNKIPLVGCGRWFEMSITSSGVVSFCCMDGKAEYPIGDVSKDHVLKVYNDPAYRVFREKFVTRLEGSPCNSCTHF